MIIFANNSCTVSACFSGTKFEELAFNDNQEQVVPITEPETPKSNSVSSGEWQIDLDAPPSQENSVPVADQAAALVKYSITVQSVAGICMPVDTSGSSVRPQHELEDDSESITSSSADQLEASSSKRVNRLASMRCRISKKSREDFNEQEVKRLEERNNFLIRKTAMLEAVRDKMRALVADRVSK